MLTIRNEQLHAFSAQLLERFVRAEARRLREVHQGHLDEMAVEELRSMVNRGIARAARYDCVLKEDISAFLDLTVILGEDFDTRLPWANAILTNGLLDGSARMRQLAEHDDVRVRRSRP